METVNSKKSMKKPMQMNGMYDLHEVLDYIEKKYKIPVYDFHGYRSHFDNWCDNQGFRKKDPMGKDRNKSKIWYNTYCESPSGERMCPKLDDFWNYFFNIAQPQENEKFLFSVETRDSWPTVMNNIMMMIKNDFGEEFDAFLSEG
jgi:hypothetical protein